MNNNSSILTDDGKYKFCSKKFIAAYFGTSYSNMRKVIAIYFPKRKRGMLSPAEVAKLDGYLTKDELLKR